MGLHRVPQSSRVRDSMLRARPISSNLSLYIAPGTMMARYWSHMVKSQNREVSRVRPTICQAFLTLRIRPPNRVSTQPIFSRVPPKATARMTRLMVHIWPSMPPREPSSSAARSFISQYSSGRL